MVSGFTVSETGKPEKPGKNRKQKLHLTDERCHSGLQNKYLTFRCVDYLLVFCFRVSLFHAHLYVSLASWEI